MKTINTEEELEAIYARPAGTSLDKVMRRLTPSYRRWIGASRFAVLSTVGPEGTDASPRGDDGPVVSIVDETTLHMPDWRGNNRLDSLRNIVRDDRVSLMFVVPGSANVVRVNGRAALTADEALRAAFRRGDRLPATVIVVSVSEVYFQCAKAILRSGLWTRGDESAAVPSAGDFIREFSEGFDGGAYDAGYADYAAPRLW